MITAHNNLNQVVKLLPAQAKKFAPIIRMSKGFVGKLLGSVSLQKIADASKVWNVQNMVDGLNFLLQQVSQSTVFYHYWDETSRKKEQGKQTTAMAVFLQKTPASAVFVLPGGGYGAVATIQEGFPIAQELYRMGYHVFVVQYRTGKYATAPNPIEDLAQSVRFVLSRQDEFLIANTEYAVLGFSAGGHLAATFGTKALGYSYYGLPKPQKLVLAYPVITMGEHTHPGSRNNLLGINCKNNLMINRYSVEKMITPEYPQCYIWQCTRDDLVPIQNTQLLVDALDANNISYDYLTYDSDAHGLGLGTGSPAEGWLENAFSAKEKEKN